MSILVLVVVSLAFVTGCRESEEGNRRFGTIFNNDINNILNALGDQEPVETLIADYRRALSEILEAKPGILAQNVGMPDPVIYRSRVATTWDKYHNQSLAERWGKEAAEKDWQAAGMKALLDAGTDPLLLTIEACRERDVLIVASYRMNAEDFYEQTTNMSDFGRAHKHQRIPGANCLDPAHPEVYRHRMEIFAEVANEYDIDGIEFDFRRWTHMISDPLKNHPVLTRMVAETRQLLDEVAEKKGRKKLILGARVGPSLADAPATEYPGGNVKNDISCERLGLDVGTWIEKGYVDYVSPTLFWPRWPGHPNTGEFVELAKGRNVGIYPTLFPLPGWLDKDESPDKAIDPGDTEKLKKYKEGLCEIALQMYEDGADGISTFNWYFHLHLARMPKQWHAYYGYGMGGSALQKYFLSILGSPGPISDYRSQPWFWPPEPSL